MCAHSCENQIFFVVGLNIQWYLQMLGNLINPPEPFADVIRTHYRLKAKTISAQLDDWLTQDDGSVTAGDGASVRKRSMVPGTSSNGFKKDIDELKSLLGRLQNEEGPSAH